jgi:hypothetical protein
MIKPHQVKGHYGTIYLFDLVPSGGTGSGWVLVVHARQRGRHDLEFKRVRFVNGHPHANVRDPQLLFYHTAWITEEGVAHLPDDEMHAMELEDRIALEEILRALPDHPPFKVTTRANPASVQKNPATVVGLEAVVATLKAGGIAIDFSLSVLLAEIERAGGTVMARRCRDEADEPETVAVWVYPGDIDGNVEQELHEQLAPHGLYIHFKRNRAFWYTEFVVVTTRANPARIERRSPDAFVAGATPGRKRGPKPGGWRRGVIGDDARATMYAMRDAGATYQAIADALGVSKVAVWKALHRP